MNVSPASASNVSELRETKVNSREVKNDHDRDDATGAASAAPLPTVNASGQSVGTVINKSA